MAVVAEVIQGGLSVSNLPCPILSLRLIFLAPFLKFAFLLPKDGIPCTCAIVIHGEPFGEAQDRPAKDGWASSWFDELTMNDSGLS